MTETTKNSDDSNGAGGQPAAEPRIGPDGKPMAPEYGGPRGPEPTRHGEWEVNGRVVDF